MAAIVDLFDPAFLEDPYPSLRAWRAEGPVHRHQSGTWFLLGYDEVACGLADAHFGKAAGVFLKAAIARAQAMARDAEWPELLERKRLQRERDEEAKPLQSYREEELAHLKLNFYGFDSSYHVARYHFVYKMPKARTPGYLATHRT